MKVATYAGPPPTQLSAQVNERILGVLEMQLKVLQSMTTQVMMIPEGTRVRMHEEPEK